MKNGRNVLEELQYSMDSLRGNLHVLETNVSVEKQMEYFRFSEAVRSNFFGNHSLEEQMEVLNSDISSPSEIKYALAFLATSGDVKAYRAIEAYSATHADEWTAMSLMQARITLESEFSDERQVFISTGLGGKDDRLRFYAFFKSTGGKIFTDYQIKLIEKEIPYCIKNYQGMIEELQIHDNYFTLLFLIHLQIDIKNMLEDAINECNQYGDFINKGFIITNVKVFSEEEIQYELKRKE